MVEYRLYVLAVEAAHTLPAAAAASPLVERRRRAEHTLAGHMLPALREAVPSRVVASSWAVASSLAAASFAAASLAAASSAAASWVVASSWVAAASSRIAAASS